MGHNPLDEFFETHTSPYEDNPIVYESSIGLVQLEPLPSENKLMRRALKPLFSHDTTDVFHMSNVPIDADQRLTQDIEKLTIDLSRFNYSMAANAYEMLLIW
ncbi:uncharacterized protein LOC141677883 isoform X1 [Apium graveolens]|uniref:uncharacterized protein LOC141677883 isoform X1 n=1 Tax=Apium graveolens TaxID=4045 RepID=UPI003D7BCC2E